MNAADATPFTRLEQQVLRLAVAGGERPAPRSAAGRLVRRAADRLSARRGGDGLANARLEALREHAAALRFGAGASDATLLDAGYSAEQADAVRALVRAAPRRAAQRRDRMVYFTGITLGLASMLSFVGMTGALVMNA